jgi:FAD/FMN-containing dehydrogenase
MAYPELIRAAPRELMVELAIIDTANGPVLVAMTCFSGSPADADAALRPFREIVPPVADDIGLRDYPSVGTPSTDMIARFPAPPDDTPAGAGEIDNFNHWRGCNVTEIDAAAAARIVDAMRNAPPGASFGLGHAMKGAALESGPADTALPRQAGSLCAYFSASWRHAGQPAAHMAWVDTANNALAARSTTPTYVNYLASNAEADISATYGANYNRLRTIKARWDPENLFRNNRNIRVA